MATADKNEAAPVLSRLNLVSRASSIQSRLSQLAAALSPSHSLTPASRRDPSLTPIKKRTENLPDPCSASPITVQPEQHVEHYPINTPPPFESDSNILMEQCKLEIDSYMKSFIEQTNIAFDRLQKENDRKEAIKAEFFRESAIREEALLQEISCAISNLEISKEQMANSLRQETMASIEQKILNDREAQKEQIAEISRKKLSEIFVELHAIESKAKHRPALEEIVAEQLEKIKNKVESHFGKEVDVLRDVAEENRRLRSLVRKMKIGLSKWRVDYMQHADSASIASSATVKKPSHTVHSHDFVKISQSLRKVWKACGPSDQELDGFLSNIELALSQGSNLDNVYKVEYEKTTAKLPLAQLAARLDWLIAKPLKSLQERMELDQIQSQLQDLIFDYEKKHGTFIYDGRDYSKVFERISVRGI